MSLPTTGSHEAIPSTTLESVACPFCGMLCDDLVVNVAAVPHVRAHGCARSRALFSAVPASDVTPQVDGKSATLDRAIARAAEILTAAAQPVFLSAGTDVAGMRTLLELAERTGGVIDHVNSDAALRNLLVLQDTGWVSTTLTEVRNRCDLLVVAGSEVGSRFPRFFERCIENRESMFDGGKREIVFLGTPPAGFESRHAVSVMKVPPHQLGGVFAALRCLLTRRPLRATEIAGVALADLSALLERMQSARYGVLTWAAAELNFPHAELAIQSACELVQLLNERSRFAVLPLAGNDGDLTTVQAATWQTGYPLRVSFGGGVPAFDPLHFRGERLIARGEADALLFVNAFDPDRTPPASSLPTILLGRPGTSSERATVFIPLATPGLHHAGHLFRTDNVVAIRLRQIADSPWPSAATALHRILGALGARS
jgi:formylmethanofuran dehydrogenase subunit B